MKLKEKWWEVQLAAESGLDEVRILIRVSAVILSERVAKYLHNLYFFPQIGYHNLMTIVYRDCLENVSWPRGAGPFMSLQRDRWNESLQWLSMCLATLELKQ